MFADFFLVGWLRAPDIEDIFPLDKGALSLNSRLDLGETCAGLALDPFEYVCGILS